VIATDGGKGFRCIQVKRGTKGNSAEQSQINKPTQNKRERGVDGKFVSAITLTSQEPCTRAGRRMENKTKRKGKTKNENWETGQTTYPSLAFICAHGGRGNGAREHQWGKRLKHRTTYLRKRA